MIDKATWAGMSPGERDDHLLAALEGVLGQLASIQVQLHDLKALPAHERDLERSVSRLREEVETLRSPE